MGSGQSKVCVACPKKISCFPLYSEESLQETVTKIGECHKQAVQIASFLATSLLSPTGVSSQLVFSAASVLFTFMLHRLSSAGSNNNFKEGGADSTVNGSLVPTEVNTAAQGNGPNVITLEDALISAKVSTAIANKSVCELQAKIYVIKRRYDRLSSSISRNEKRLEVVPAVQTCQEVLQLFRDPAHVFYMHPLITAPFLATFAGIFAAVAEIAIALIPSYQDSLVSEMDLAISTLEAYKCACVKKRMETVKLKFIPPANMLDAVASTMNEFNYRLEDTCSASNGTSSPMTFYDDTNKAIAACRDELELEFEDFFKPAIQAASNFSGYFSDAADEFKPDSDDSSDDDVSDCETIIPHNQSTN